MYNKLKVTLFGTCRLESLSDYNNKIRNEISYTYDTKEILEVIRFIKHNHLSEEQTITTFRTPMLTKIPIYSKQFENIFEETDIYIIEISSRKTYKHNNIYIHRALYTMINDLTSKSEVIKQSDDEIENDILEIIHELNAKNVIIVCHIVTDTNSERYKLSEILENICLKHKLFFINPVKEINKKGYNINDLVSDDNKIYHYNENGHMIMKNIYEEYINKVNNQTC